MPELELIPLMFALACFALSGFAVLLRMGRTLYDSSEDEALELRYSSRVWWLYGLGLRLWIALAAVRLYVRYGVTLFLLAVYPSYASISTRRFFKTLPQDEMETVLRTAFVAYKEMLDDYYASGGTWPERDVKAFMHEMPIIYQDYHAHLAEYERRYPGKAPHTLGALPTPPTH